MALQGPVPPGGHSLPEPVRGGAVRFSRCRAYRWWLERRWQPGAPRLLFVGLNPSRADGEQNDPTLRRLIGFARSWGFGALEVVNLFSAIASKPLALRALADPVGPETDAWITRRALAPEVAVIWLGWGEGGGWRGRDQQVLRLLLHCGVGDRCGVIGVTGHGRPRHPLYVPAGRRLLCWSELAAEGA